ncbi:MAG TPA: transposase [Candidatus Sulfotelmatobacter sp.]|nr:transposase [Candidatus Sulfotelmatobacter sp.]
MSYVSIAPATKTAAVKHYWQTGNLQGTANKFGVSRNAIYEWVRIAEGNLEQAFRASTPGKRTATLAEQNAKLRAQLDEVLDIYHRISQRPRPTRSLARCPRCQGTKLLRNGRIRTKREGLLQRLWCRACNVSVYIDLKKTL